jgi:endo-1,4-beta-xylanase
MKKILLLTVPILCLSALAEPGLKDVYANDFLCGVALHPGLTPPSDPKAEALIAGTFNSVVAENCMKPISVQPREGEFHFEEADRLVAFAEKHKMAVIGHTLVWHSQVPDWLFKGPDGKPATRELLLERMHKHIQTVMGHYKGRVRGWDVVNEAIEGDGSLRKSPFQRIIGDDFIEQAFRFAHEADPDAELYYNDYGMADRVKRERVVRLIKELRGKGLRIDAVGMQSHVSLAYPDIKEYEASIQAFAAAGVKVNVTELDISVLPWIDGAHTADISKRADYTTRIDPYRAGLPADVSAKLTGRYVQLFTLYHKYRANIDRVTFWGFSDRDSWLNNFPVRGRMDYPLLFDRSLNPKPCLEAIKGIPK